MWIFVKVYSEHYHVFQRLVIVRGTRFIRLVSLANLEVGHNGVREVKDDV